MKLKYKGHTIVLEGDALLLYDGKKLREKRIVDKELSTRERVAKALAKVDNWTKLDYVGKWG